jgi:hypothetical protein
MFWLILSAFWLLCSVIVFIVAWGGGYPWSVRSMLVLFGPVTLLFALALGFIISTIEREEP